MIPRAHHPGTLQTCELLGPTQDHQVRFPGLGVQHPMFSQAFLMIRTQARV